MYYAVRDSYATWGLYEMGTVVFTALCMSLQCKVAFLHHQYTWPQGFVMALSIGGMLAWFAIIADSYDDYTWVANYAYSTGLFWWFGMFTVPLVCLLLDFVGYCLVYFFKPTNEMYFREIEHSVSLYS
jgi:magnesium-transporting ATPase (P-type)